MRTRRTESGEVGGLRSEARRSKERASCMHYKEFEMVIGECGMRSEKTMKKRNAFDEVATAAWIGLLMCCLLFATGMCAAVLFKCAQTGWTVVMHGFKAFLRF
jgi:hypothetical protein